jgi:hypothetical protein
VSYAADVLIFALLAGHFMPGVSSFMREGGFARRWFCPAVGLPGGGFARGQTAGRKFSFFILFGQRTSTGCQAGRRQCVGQFLSWTCALLCCLGRPIMMMMMSFIVLSETKSGLTPYTCLGSVFSTMDKR